MRCAKGFTLVELLIAVAILCRVRPMNRGMPTAKPRENEVLGALSGDQKEPVAASQSKFDAPVVLRRRGHT